MFRLLFWGFATLIAGALSAQINPLPQLLSRDSLLGTIANQPAYEVQLIYTQIDRDAQNVPHFTTYAFREDSNRYFYPASTVKMPAAFLALEKINELGLIGFDRDASMLTGAGRPPQAGVASDTTSANGLPSIGHYIRKIFLVSDNDAFNRLYEFLGQAYLNRSLREKGYRHLRIIHRLSVSGFDTLGNQYTNPIAFQDAVGKPVYFQGEGFSRDHSNLRLRGEQKGNGYLNGNDQLVNQPFDFSSKNYVGLRELHDMLQAVVFPEAVPPARRFLHTPEDRAFLLRAMSERPRESAYPAYPEKDFWDSYVKFFLYGDTQERMPDHIRVFNKVGIAYGFVTDVAYVVDFDNKVEFLLAATIHTNANGIYNDGQYEYDQVAFPFLARLGRAIHQYEIQRPRRRAPDLSAFEMNYAEKK
ncbi:MAG: serine hydrolase [Lewinellaceae bacterium]|nr:serine hydrolase [Lewinellaceae bacterium]